MSTKAKAQPPPIGDLDAEFVNLQATVAYALATLAPFAGDDAHVRRQVARLTRLQCALADESLEPATVAGQ